MEDLGGDKYRGNDGTIARGAAAHDLFIILSVFVPAKTLHERLFISFSVFKFVLLDPPLCGPGTLTVLKGACGKIFGVGPLRPGQGP